MFSEDYEIAAPRASAMVESMRAVGYTPETAIADLVDNSIAAAAENVWITFWWAGADSYVSITDDGRGMSETGLFEAMRPGTVGPLEERPPEDLGRFGLGLKTASFSQCRRLTVLSQPRGSIHACRRWDLDYVQQHNEWRLLKSPAGQSESRLRLPEGAESGTVVLWEQLDRIVGDATVENSKARDHFLKIVRDVDDHLAMVFHRLLDGKKPRLRIWIGAGSPDGPKAVQPWDPFLETHSATIAEPEESITLRNGVVTVKGFVLPHKSRFDEGGHERAGGPGGWNARQGFYVYRNERLIVPGSWLGIGTDRQWTREEHYKLARIRVDFPNSMDLDWQLDVKKSDARPPGEIRDRLKDIALVVRTKARQVYAYRGGLAGRKGQPAKEPETPWKALTREGHPLYRLKRDYPLLRHTRSTTSGEDLERLDILFRIIEETVPVHRVFIDMAERPDSPLAPFELEDQAEVIALARHIYRSLIDVVGVPRDEAADRITRMEPFVRRPDLDDILGSLES